MRIFFIGKRHYTNQDALTQRFGRIYQLPLHWHHAGHTVRLVLFDYHALRREASERNGFAVRSLPAFDPRSTAVLSRTAEAFQPDIIVASGDCLLGILGLRLARRLDARFVFDVYDDYRTFAAYRAFAGLDALGFLCRRADMVTYASRAMADNHVFESASSIVPNGVDETAFTAVPQSKARAKLDIPQAGRLVGYFGSMTAEHGVGVLIHALEKVRLRQADLRLLLCGKQNRSTPVNADGVLYRGMVPHHTIPGYMNACDVLALPYLHGDFIDSASSCKIAEYLFCRRPIVATRTPNFVRNFPEQAGQLDALLVPPGDADALACSIQRQLDYPLTVQPPEDMTWRRIGARLIEAFERLF